jgi:hypothetical protein
VGAAFPFVHSILLENMTNNEITNHYRMILGQKEFDQQVISTANFLECSLVTASELVVNNLQLSEQTATVKQELDRLQRLLEESARLHEMTSVCQ